MSTPPHSHGQHTGPHTSTSTEYIKPSRIASLDIGRMLAAFAVVLYHGSMELTDPKAPIFLAGSMGVTFFMVLSGYVLAMPYFENQGARQRAFEFVPYLKRRIVRIVPPYYFMVAIGAGLTALNMGSTANPVPPGTLPWHVVTHLLFIHTFFKETYSTLVSVLWSLGLEGQYYMLFPLLYVALRRYSSGAVLAAVVVISLAFRAMIIAYFPDLNHWLNGVSIARLPEFALGMLFAYSLGDRPKRLPIPVLAGVSFVFFVAGLIMPSNLLRALSEGAAFFLVLMVLRLWGPKAAGNPLLKSRQFLRIVSYSTFLVHTVAGKVYMMLLGKVAPGLPQSSLFLAFVGYVVTGHLAGITLFYTVERPLTQFLGRLLNTSPNKNVKGGF